jgi:FkbM family methyltransferase
MPSQQHVIFDLGMHYGLDTAFYMKKGFRVVALEASATLCQRAEVEFKEYLDTGQLHIVQKALWDRSGETIEFFINNEKDDWSSIHKSWAEKGGHQAISVVVETITLNDLTELYGVPYYVKCDIEGADIIFAKQLLASSERPKFISTEAISLEVLACMSAAGYDRFQIVNQIMNPYTPCPTPSLEGNYVDQTFNGHMSGLFGKELPASNWKCFTDTAQAYLDFMRLQATHDIAVGWLDFHATTVDTLHEKRSD